MKHLTRTHKRQTTLPRHAGIALGVVLLHACALWALQSGLLHPPVAVLVPAQMLAEFVAPPAPTVQPAQPAALKAPTAHAKAAPQRPPQPMPMPMPVAMADAPPAQAAPVGVATPAPPAADSTAPMAANATAPSAHPAPPAPARLEPPSSDADYLQNPKPVYPGVSKRLGEQGRVIHSVFIGADGLPIRAELVQSSGFDRLDQAAYSAVMRWRYVPGKRNGVPTAMSFNVPIVWELN